MAEHAGDRSPDRSQRLLSRASWDERARAGCARMPAGVRVAKAVRRRTLERAIRRAMRDRSVNVSGRLLSRV